MIVEARCASPKTSQIHTVHRKQDIPDGRVTGERLRARQRRAVLTACAPAAAARVRRSGTQVNLIDAHSIGDRRGRIRCAGRVPGVARTAQAARFSTTRLLRVTAVTLDVQFLPDVTSKRNGGSHPPRWPSPSLARAPTICGRAPEERARSETLTVISGIYRRGRLPCPVASETSLAWRWGGVRRRVDEPTIGTRRRRVPEAVGERPFSTDPLTGSSTGPRRQAVASSHTGHPERYRANEPRR